MAEPFSLKIAHWDPLYQTPVGGVGSSRQGQGEIPPGDRLAVTNSRSLLFSLVAPLLSNVESPLRLSLVVRHPKCEVTVTESELAAAIRPFTGAPPVAVAAAAAVALAATNATAITRTRPPDGLKARRRPRRPPRPAKISLRCQLMIRSRRPSTGSVSRPQMSKQYGHRIAGSATVRTVACCCSEVPALQLSRDREQVASDGGCPSRKPEQGDSRGTRDGKRGRIGRDVA